MAKEIFKPEEVARMCYSSTPTILRRIREGKLEAFRAAGGRDYRVPKEAVLRFFREHKMPIPEELIEQKRILIVDDDDRFRGSLERHFHRSGAFKVQTASSGFSAGSAIQSFKPHLILLDILLGDIDGRELLKMLKKDDGLKKTRVIAISGYLKEGEAKDLAEVGFDDYLAKPFKLSELSRKVEALLGSAFL
jgi:excisionase family DNA binding protein